MIDFIRHIQKHDQELGPSTFEVILAYPGFHIMTLFHPVAAFLHGLGLKALGRFWSYVGRFVTGIEIHPGAAIGKNLFIDHGTGVVIGQTAIIGDNCFLYQGVTLGSRGNHAPGERRHPKLGDNVMIGSGAQILGPVTIGDNARIGAGAVVTMDIPPGVTVVGNPARITGANEPGTYCYGLPEGNVEDPLLEKIEQLEEELRTLKSARQKV